MPKDTKSLDLLATNFGNGSLACLSERGNYAVASTETKTYGDKQVTVTKYSWTNVNYTAIVPVDGVYTFTLPLDPYGPDSHASGLDQYGTHYWGPVGELLRSLGTVTGSNLTLQLKADAQAARDFCAAIDMLEACNLTYHTASREKDLGAEESLDILPDLEDLNAAGLYVAVQADANWEKARGELTRLLKPTAAALKSRSLTDREVLAFWRACRSFNNNTSTPDEPIAQIYYSLKAYSTSKTVTWTNGKGRIVVADLDKDDNIVAPAGKLDLSLLLYYLTHQQTYTVTVSGTSKTVVPGPLVADGKGGERELAWKNSSMSEELDWCLLYEHLLSYKDFMETLGECTYNKDQDPYDDQGALARLKSRTADVSYAVLASKWKAAYPDTPVPSVIFVQFTSDRATPVWEDELYLCGYCADLKSCEDVEGLFASPEAVATTTCPVSITNAYSQEGEHYHTALVNSKKGTPGAESDSNSWFLNFKWWWWLIIILVVYIIYKFFSGNSESRAAKEAGRQERKTLKLQAKLDAKRESSGPAGATEQEGARPSRNQPIKI